MITCEIKCPACGCTGPIEEHGTQSSGMVVLPRWNDNLRHIHDYNRYITTFRCLALSGGHPTVCGAVWDIIHTTPCPVDVCEYGDELNERVVHRSRTMTECELHLRDIMPKMKTERD